MKEENLLCRM